jgi:gliding motility-associated-like protein
LNSTNQFTYITCNEDYFIQFGKDIYNSANPIGQSLLDIPASNGCDSLVNVNLSFTKPNTLINVTDALCEDTDGLITITNTDLNEPINFIVDDRIIGSISELPYEYQLSPGEHNIVLRDAENCSTTNTVDISVDASPQVAINEITQNDGSKRLMITSDVPLTSINWIPSASVDCSTCENVLVLQYGQLDVIYDFGIGCVDTLSYTVLENVKEEIYFPNIINLNSVNNKFFPQKSDSYIAKAKSMSIFDRWGNRVFHNENFEIGFPEEGWDGKLNGNKLNPGVYVFTLQIEDANGKTKYFAGDVTLIE